MDYFLAILMMGLATLLVLYVPMVVLMDDIKAYRQDQTLKKEEHKKTYPFAGVPLKKVNVMSKIKNCFK